MPALAVEKAKTNPVSLAWYWQSLRFKERLALDLWADKNRVLSPESSAEPGEWKTSRVPYARGIMQAVSDPAIETVVIKSSSQVSKTEIGLNMLGSYAEQDPCPVLVVVPNLDEAKHFSKMRLAPMFRDSPALAGMLRETRGKQAKASGQSNEVLVKTFPGGHVTIVGSNSASGLASKPIRVVYIDELDRFEPGAGKEGDQVMLAKRRQATFWNRKMLITSTPGVKGISRIDTWYEASDQRKFYLPCPRCNEPQVLLWDNFRWDRDSDRKPVYESAHFVCQFCKARIEEEDKLSMLDAGDWRAAKPTGKIAGFWLWAAYSPWVTWPELCQEWYAAKGQGPEQLKTYVNTMRGESWEEEGDAPEWLPLMERASTTPEWTIPDGVHFLTAGVDVQGDRVEVSVWGWGEGEQAYLIGHQIIEGDFDEQETQNKLDAFLQEQWAQPSRGRRIGLRIACQDSGARTQAVYNFARSRRGFVYAIKGASTLTAPRIARPKLQDVNWKGNVIEKGVFLWMLGTHTLKSTLYNRMKLKKPGPKYVNFPWGLTDEYYKQLTAERLVNRYHNGQLKQEWHKLRKNETLDCFVYAYAAALILGIERIPWDKVEPTKGEQQPLVTQSKPEPARSQPAQPQRQIVTGTQWQAPRNRATQGGTLARLLRK